MIVCPFLCEFLLGYNCFQTVYSVFGERNSKKLLFCTQRRREANVWQKSKQNLKNKREEGIFFYLTITKRRKSI